MTRLDFINILYNNGRGLTLDQIAKIDDDLSDTIPDGLIDDIMETLMPDGELTIEQHNKLYGRAKMQAMEQARDVCISAYADAFVDPIEVKEYFRNYAGFAEVPDDNCVGLFYAIHAGL